MKIFWYMLSVACLFSSSVWATETTVPKYSSFKDFLQQTEASGNIRSYYFNRNFGNPAQPHQWAYSLGGMLNLRSADFYGFRADVAYYAADDLNIEADLRKHRDRTLPPGSVNVLGQGYLQYARPKWLIRVGNQFIDTPFLNQADSRMIPALYQAALASFMPVEAVKVEIMRVIEYKNRTSTRFNQTNLYTANIPGSSSPVPSLFNVDVIGALAGGVTYNLTPVRANLWYYKFYNFSNLLYGDAEYIFRNSIHLDPIIAAQIAGEWGDGKNYLQEAGLGKSQAMAYGLLAGLEVPEGRVSVGYDAMPVRHTDYRAGDLISPYTAGYQADPLYTTSMNAGLIERAAGHAFKLDTVYHFLDKQLRTEWTYAKYYVAGPVHNTSETDFDVTYEFKQRLLKGLLLRNRLGILNGDVSRGRYVYYRFMVQYDF